VQEGRKLCAVARHLRAIHCTAREVRRALQFLAYASQGSAQASEPFAQRIQRHLQSCRVTLRDLTWQTDNGGEFIGELQPDGSRSHFPRALTYFGSREEGANLHRPSFPIPAKDFPCLEKRTFPTGISDSNEIFPACYFPYCLS
jgi:hypothetical protein